ncbi:outer membrane lipoprotein carrier protein LolA [candidate division KSB1 bacterium]|nr:outer membrane lipoprotein carrier protein LolA [candidate division KSB1 bacterium]
MKKMCILTILTFTLVSAGVGQDADEILKKIQKTYLDMKAVCADFEQTFYWKLADETQTFTGKVCTRNGEQFRIETEDQIIITDGKAIWTLSHINKQVLIDDAAESTEDNPFLKSFMQNYIDHYQAKLVQETKIGETPHYLLELEAKSEDEFARLIKVWVDKKTYLMTKIVQTDINENTSTYEVNDVDTNAKLTDASFQLTPPSGYEVVDMRVE